MTDKTQQRLNELESIIVREQDMLFRFAYMRVGRRADAEDIVQDVFLKLFRSSESLTSVRNVKRFMMKFGKDFAYVGNQYDLEVFGEEQRSDLLFFNRQLNCLVAIELKAGKFTGP